MSKAEWNGSRGGIQVIARAAAVLRALRVSRTGMSLGQIADRVGLPRSTVQRIVAALEAERLVTAPGGGSGIRLGPELYSLAESARSDVADTVRPLLQDLSRETGETVDLAVFRGHVVVFIDQIAGTQRLRAVSSVGEAFPLTTTANGKASLALMDDDAIVHLAHTEWTEAGRDEPDMARFMTEIARVRETGIAFDKDEHTAGISAVGMAFRDSRADIYSVSIPTPTARFQSIEPKLVAAIANFHPRIEAIACP